LITGLVGEPDSKYQIAAVELTQKDSRPEKKLITLHIRMLTRAIRKCKI
jgi:hypothetical protein